MNIVEAPNIQQYTDPTQWVRDKILPIKITCSKCKSIIVLDHESDMYATRHNTIGFTCMICGDKRHWPRPTEEEKKKYEAEVQWALLSDEEYEDVRAKAVIERAKTREKYLSYGIKGEHRKETFNAWNSISHRQLYRDSARPFPTYEEYIEEKYLPLVPPEKKPGSLSKFMVHYDDVLEYYQKQLPKPNVKAQTAEIQMPTGVGFVASVVVVSLVVIYLMFLIVQAAT